MTTPLSQEQRAELVAKAKAATPGPWRIVPYDCGDIDYLDNAPMVAAAPELDCAIVHWEGFVQRYWRSARGEKEIQANAAFIAAANPEAILSYEATVQALTVERDAALERVKALEAGLVSGIAGIDAADAACPVRQNHRSALGQDRCPKCYARSSSPCGEVSGAERTLINSARALLTPKDPGHG